MRFLIWIVAAVVAVGVSLGHMKEDADFRFVILGDRTGEAQPGVYEEALREANSSHPRFIINVGDSVEGGNDATIDIEWQQFFKSISPFTSSQMFFTPGNHDVWSADSARAYQQYTKQALHYSFDFKQAHFTVLDDSRSDQLAPDENAYLESDLKQHVNQPIKFVFSHRPFWLLQALLGNPDAPIQRVAEKFGVQYFIAGHIHQMLQFQVRNVRYLSLPSAGGHLRGKKDYQSGWFFAKTLVTVKNGRVGATIQELNPPFGQSRTTHPEDWGSAGLVSRRVVAPAQ